MFRALGVALFMACIAVSASAADTVRSLVEAASVSDLRWPDFGDYRAHLDAFYRGRGDALAWSRNGAPTAQASALIEIFKAADARGVNAVDYDSDRWLGRVTALRSGASPEALARFDVAMTATLMRYISDLHIGRINPRRVEFLLDVNPKKYDLPALVATLVDANDIAARLEQVEPPYAGYRRLREQLARYRKLAAEGDGALLPRTKLVAPGDKWEGLPQLATLLRRTGDLADENASHETYDQQLVDAVKRFQRRHGLEADGRIARATLAALDVPLSARLDQIRLAMERWRWLPSEFTSPPIVVNIPEYRLRAYDSDQRVALTMNVVVGKSFPSRQTPVFADTLEYVVFRPYWNVPRSIEKNEIRPKMASDPGYAQRNGYEIHQGSVRQKPGPGNALGNVKFIFPNPMNVYLHDTSSRQLFDRSRRDFSHGCIRVGNPAALAEWVLRDDPKWTRAAVAEAMSTGPTDRRVNTPPIPILIVYATAVAPEEGNVLFFDDIYGHDATLEDALAGGYPYPS